jgi:hypothetical protein
MIGTFQRAARPAPHEIPDPLARRDTPSAVVRDGRWVMIRDLHLIRDFTAAELEVVRLEKSRAGNPDEVRSIELVLSRQNSSA